MKQEKWYSKTEEEVIKELNASRSGLSEKEAKARLEVYGPNVLPKGKQKNVFQVFLSQLKDPIVIVLLITTVISIIIQEYVDAFFILIVILLDAVLGTFQEWKAEKSAASLQDMVKVKLLILRDQTEIEIDSEKLVPGDIVFLEPGNKVSGDIRLLESHNLTVDEAFLTGESIASNKNTELITKDVNPSEQYNMWVSSSQLVFIRKLD